ncbi:MAG: hypothetical protein GY829_06680 [Gammaproteobacteria bacterium]|nr:hypothetical protein [Gammaproteobacteria bacterium]
MLSISGEAQNLAEEKNMNPKSKDKRSKRDLHFLNDDGMVICNHRDPEAAHRAEVEGIATENIASVTCKKCWEFMGKKRGV